MDSDEYVPMEKRAVRTLGKGCLFLLIFPAAMFAIALIDLLLTKIGQEGMGGTIFLVLGGTLFLLGIMTLLYTAPKKIIPEARRRASWDRGIFSILVGIFIAIIWIAIITQRNPSGLKPGITAGLLIQWGIILYVCHFFSRGVWSLARPKQLEDAAPATVKKSSPPPAIEKKLRSAQDNAATGKDRQKPKPQKKDGLAAVQSKSPGDWEYCENCGKEGAELFAVFSRQYTFCNETCKEEFGNKLFLGGAAVFCPFCGVSQPVTKADPRLCRSCHADMDDLEDSADDTGSDVYTEMIKTLQIADDTLYQSNNPDYEINLAEQLMQSPDDAIRAIEHRGWEKRGTAEEGTRFAIRVLERIIREADGPIREKAFDAIIGIFATPDDNSTGWQSMQEQAVDVIAKNNDEGVESKLEELKKRVSGRNVQAIDYALNFLKSD